MAQLLSHRFIIHGLLLGLESAVVRAGTLGTMLRASIRTNMLFHCHVGLLVLYIRSFSHGSVTGYISLNIRSKGSVIAYIVTAC